MHLTRTLELRCSEVHLTRTLELRCSEVHLTRTLELRSEVHEVHTHTDTWTRRHTGPWSSYLKMDLKSDFFDFFQPICFWKAETKLEMNLLEFLGSEVI